MTAEIVYAHQCCKLHFFYCPNHRDQCTSWLSVQLMKKPSKSNGLCDSGKRTVENTDCSSGEIRAFIRFIYVYMYSISELTNSFFQGFLGQFRATFSLRMFVFLSASSLYTWTWIYHQHHQTLLVSISLHTKINFDLLCLIRGSLGKKLSLKLSLPAHIYSGSSGHVVFICFHISIYDSAGAAQFTSLPVDIIPTLSFISSCGKGCFLLHSSHHTLIWSELT